VFSIGRRGLLAVLFGVVACSATGNSGSPNASSDASANVVNHTGDDADVQQIDSGDDGVRDDPLDASKKDAAPALVCPPEDVSNFSPTWKPPKALHAGLCSKSQAELVVDCAFDPNTNPAACDALMNDAGSSACTLCVLTDDFDSTYGPLVLKAGGYAVLNLGGCIASLSGNTTATSCGAKVQAINDCQEYACTSCTDPSTSPKAMADYLQCQKAAESAQCGSYVSAASCADALIQPDAAAGECASGSNTFLDRAHALARLFCGT
jgi:hypothetical protein